MSQSPDTKITPSAPIRAPSAVPVDDAALPFEVDVLDLRGRLTRLGPALDDILTRHDYPAPVCKLLGEAIVLTTLLGSSLKFDGRFILQTQTDGPVSFLIVDFQAPDRLRAYARFDATRLRDGQDSGALLGKGHLAMTIDQGADMSRYQGLVALEGGNLEDAAHEYFLRSEQIPTRVRLAVGEEWRGGDDGPKHRWRAGGMLLQFLPKAPERARVPDLPPGDAPEGMPTHVVAEDAEDDAWVEGRSMIETVEDLYSERHPSSTEEGIALEIEKVKLVEVSLAYIKTYGIDSRREIVYEMPLINPTTGRAMHAFRVAGKIDGLISLGNKHAKVIEDKFVQQIQKVMIDKLPLDDQMTEYVDALSREGWTAEVEYRHTRYPGINPEKPKEYKKKDNYPGETLEEFGERLAADLVERHSFYFDVQRLMFSTEHMEEYRLHRWQVGKEILERRREAKKLGIAAWYKNPSRCGDWGGCSFIPLCTMQEGAEHLYEVSDVQDPELETGGGANGDEHTDTA
jgi:molecular chaperone Hsp33